MGHTLVLKEWDEDKQLLEVDFSFSTFFIQVHGLPHTLLNEKNVVKIGSTLGEILPFSGKMVVA